MRNRKTGPSKITARLEVFIRSPADMPNFDLPQTLAELRSSKYFDQLQPGRSLKEN